MMNNLFILSSKLLPRDLADIFGSQAVVDLAVGQEKVLQKIISEYPLNTKVFISVCEGVEISETIKNYINKIDAELMIVPKGLDALSVLKKMLSKANPKKGDKVFVHYGEKIVQGLRAHLKQKSKGLFVVDSDRNYLQTHSGRFVHGVFFFRFTRRVFDLLTCYSIDEFILGLFSCEDEIYLSEADAASIDGYLSWADLESKNFEVREFNSISKVGGIILKQSRQKKKLKAEYFWLQEKSNQNPLSVPRVLGAQESDEIYSYQIEYLPYPSLHYLHRNSRLGVNKWHKIFRKIKENFLDVQCVDSSEFTTLLEKKFRDRFNLMQTFLTQEQLQLTSHLHRKLINSLPNDLYKCGHFHGDLCFSNLLYNPFTENVLAIDPRGLDFSGEKAGASFYVYDLAKLYHSIIGYDKILCGDYVYSSKGLYFDQYYCENLSDVFYDVFECDREVINLITAHLFLSMIPLHRDRPESVPLFIEIARGLVN
ncbi:aminoglycoside phosphotransferase family protein [Alphaproteobacteria bacterium]|nr:aminoglycoside phosphotransferase family protein [Alphaproteobacteria bacterium]MDB2406716.1 aminoglycoside phosphotransferase family protein [Alphaproteobacteria bacterium]MDB2540614.1 aminoglycoside phosphotransferase family protein [Alphaproteobacteria bacterium]MDB2649027.1 aminoglycoside phosphotransferase family protein [Alphaproteobacteria bacterium]